MNKDTKKIFGVEDCLSKEQMMDYIHDRLSMKERNYIERHMMSCELCSEAMEGFELMDGKEENFGAVISDINKTIGTRTSDSKIRWMAAASLALAILGGGLVYLNLQLGPEKGSISEVNNDPDTMKVAIQKDDKVELKIVEKDSIVLNKNEKIPDEKLSFSSKPIEERVGVSSGYEVTSDAYVPKEENEKEEKVTEEFDSELNGSGNVITESYNAAPVTESKDLLKSQDLKEVSISKDVKEDKKQNYYSTPQKNKSKKRAAVPTYRSESAGKTSDIIYESDKLDDFEELVEDEVPVKTIKDGVELYDQKQYKEAVEVFEAILKESPASDKALYYNALSNFELKQYEQALLNLEKIKKESSYSEDALQLKAKTYLAKGEKEKAKLILEEILKGGGKYRSWAEEELKK